MMAKRSCSHEEKGQKPKCLTHFKKKAMTMKKVIMTIALLPPTHKKGQRGTRPWWGNTI